MLVRDYMTTSPITINADKSVQDALNILKKYKLRALPVTHKQRLVGLVTEKELLAVSPSPATTLSVYEIKDLLSKLVVKDVMNKTPITVDSDCTIEEAALVMREHRIGTLLVMEEEELVGIITQTDIFEALIRLFGLRKVGTRIVVEAKTKMGLINEITGLVRQCNVNVISIVVWEKTEQILQVTLRLATVEPEPIVEKFKEQGYKVILVS